MKAYLECIVICKKEGGDPAVSMAQTILEFTNSDQFNKFNDNLKEYERCMNFEIYRTLVKM